MKPTSWPIDFAMPTMINRKPWQISHRPPIADRQEYIDRVGRSREGLERQLRMAVMQPRSTHSWQLPKEREDS